MKVIHAALCTENRQEIRITKPCRTWNFNCNTARPVQSSKTTSPFRRAIPDKGKLHICISIYSSAVCLELLPKPCTAQFLPPGASYLGAALQSLICKAPTEKMANVFWQICSDRLFNTASDLAIKSYTTLLSFTRPRGMKAL